MNFVHKVEKKTQKTLHMAKKSDMQQNNQDTAIADGFLFYFTFLKKSKF